jgi:hypothetical protein
LPAPAATPQRRLDEARAALEQLQNGAASMPPYLPTLQSHLNDLTEITMLWYAARWMIDEEDVKKDVLKQCT